MLITLTQNKFAVIDDTDRDLSMFKWYAEKTAKGDWYAARKPNEHVYLHRSIMERILERVLDRSEIVDHIDNNGLNNLRNNLRIATHEQNLHNGRKHRDGSSQYKGVRWHTRDNRWEARIKNTFIGYFDSEEKAALAYDKKAVELFGEFSYLNFPEHSDYEC